MKLTPKELLFLTTLDELEHRHCSENFLMNKLEEYGIMPEDFKLIKKKLLYSGYIGQVYGNITLEKKDFDEET